MEFLKQILGKDIYEQVAACIEGNDKIKLANVADGSYIPKAKFNEVNTQLKELKSQVVERDSKLLELQEELGRSEELSATIERLTQEKENTIRDYESKLVNQNREFMISSEIASAKARNARAVRSLLDESKIEVVDGKVVGLTQQLDALRCSDGYLFEMSSGTGGGSNPSNVDDGGAIDMDSLSDAEYYKRIG